ncbi:hypothetical protein D3C83_331030 [compost metagenome]
MMSSESSVVPKRLSEIGAAKAIPASVPMVAMPIVNQNEVRTTVRRAAGSSESK